MTTGEKVWCVECCPEDFKDDPRPRMFLPLCEEHLAKVEPLSEEAIEKAIEEGRQAYKAVMEASSQFIPPRGYFR